MWRAKEPVNEGVGQYVLGQCLGEGSFGKVREAFHLRSLRKVAIKVVRKRPLLRIKGALAQLEQEIMILRQLSGGLHAASEEGGTQAGDQNTSSRVLQLFEVFRTAESIYLVMEWALGSLQNLLEAQLSQTLPEPSARHVFRQLMLAVELLHSRGIIHKDIKPSNIMITPDFCIKLADFGSCEVLSLYLKSRRCYRTQGTPAFQCPEIAKGVEYFDGPKSDVWSCGVTLFLMLTGRLPFRGRGLYKLFKSIAGSELSRRGLPADCAPLLEQMLDKDESRRLSVTEVLAHPWLDGPSSPSLSCPRLGLPDPGDGSFPGSVVWCLCNPEYVPHIRAAAALSSDPLRSTSASVLAESEDEEDTTCGGSGAGPGLWPQLGMPHGEPFSGEGASSASLVASMESSSGADLVPCRVLRRSLSSREVVPSSTGAGDAAGGVPLSYSMPLARHLAAQPSDTQGSPHTSTSEGAKPPLQTLQPPRSPTSCPSAGSILKRPSPRNKPPQPASDSSPARPRTLSSIRVAFAPQDSGEGDEGSPAGAASSSSSSPGTVQVAVELSGSEGGGISGQPSSSRPDGCLASPSTSEFPPPSLSQVYFTGSSLMPAGRRTLQATLPGRGEGGEAA
eukprot:RCo033743